MGQFEKSNVSFLFLFKTSLDGCLESNSCRKVQFCPISNRLAVDLK